MGSSGKKQKKEKAPRPARKAGQILGRPWWQGVAALLAVLAIGVSIWLTKDDSSPSGGNQTTNVQVSGSVGSCSAVGQGITISCVNPPATKSLGKVSLKWAGAVYFLFDGRVADLPTPPDYPADRKMGHCADWADWISGEQRIYGVGPSVHLSMVSGEPDLVVVHDITAKVLDDKNLQGEHVLIQCQYGAGLNAGYDVAVDVGTNTTSVTDLASGAVAVMPPATLSLKGREYEASFIRIVSTPLTLYSGTVNIAASVNGDEQNIMLGSQERPFRWLGGHLDDAATSAVLSQTPKYDWNTTTHQWEPVGAG